MRTIIPQNNVNVDYYNILNSFISLLVEKQNNNIKCIYLSGSYARGDATDASDLDVFCIFNKLTLTELVAVGFSAQHTPIPYEQLEINTQCLSVEEFINNDFKGWVEKSARILDSVLLYGEDIFGSDISTLELQGIYKKYFTDVLMSIRHYICVDEPVEKLTYKKIKTYILKPLMFPLRMERYCSCGVFPLTINDLKNYLEKNEKFIVDLFQDETAFNEAISKDHIKLLSNLQDIVLEKLS